MLRHHCQQLKRVVLACVLVLKIDNAFFMELVDLLFAFLVKGSPRSSLSL